MVQRVASWLLGLLRTLAGLVLPVFKPEHFSGLSRALYAVVHALVVVAILVGLYILNQNPEILRNLQISPPWLKHVWLPLMFLLPYALCWASWALWKAIVSTDIDSQHRDIDEAWQAGLAACREARIDLMNWPIFLVLGQAQEEDASVFKAGSVTFTRLPEGAIGPPVRLYACTDPKREAIYITCPDASLLSAFAIRLTRPDKAARITGIRIATLKQTAFDETKSLTPEMMKTLLPEAESDALDYQQILLEAERVGGVGPVHQRILRFFERRRSPAQLLDDQVTRVQADRLTHLCRLMRRDLSPRAPVNGVLTLLPFDATDSQQDALELAHACAGDLKVTREALGVHCPVYALVCNMESAPGFVEFVSRFLEGDRKSRVGQSFPFFPEQPRGPREPGGDVAGQLRGLASWICTSYMRRWVYEKCQLEQDTDGLGKSRQINSRLFYLLCELREREPQLATILGVGFSGHAPPDRLLFGGCYLAATGEPAGHRAFAQGVFDRILKDANRENSILYWTDEVRSDEAFWTRFVNTGWVALVTILVLGSAAGLVILNRR